MAVLRIQDFSGIVPVMGDRAIGDNYAVDSVNTWLYGGELRGLRPPTLLQSMTDQADSARICPEIGRSIMWHQTCLS